jgi:hypothetical protein
MAWFRSQSDKPELHPEAVATVGLIEGDPQGWEFDDHYAKHVKSGVTIWIAGSDYDIRVWVEKPGKPGQGHGPAGWEFDRPSKTHIHDAIQALHRGSPVRTAIDDWIARETYDPKGTFDAARNVSKESRLNPSEISSG